MGKKKILIILRTKGQTARFSTFASQSLGGTVSNTGAPYNVFISYVYAESMPVDDTCSPNLTGPVFQCSHEHFLGTLGKAKQRIYNIDLIV
jgi:hypothetical protein